MSLCKGLETFYQGEGTHLAVPAVSLWPLWKKFKLGTHPNFHLSESILQNWLWLLCLWGCFLLTLGGREGWFVFLFWVLIASHLKYCSKPSLAWVKKDLSLKVNNFLPMLCLLHVWVRKSSSLPEIQQVTRRVKFLVIWVSVSWCMYWAKSGSAAFSV